MPIFSASKTEPARDDLGALAEAHGYSGRSEVIRDACKALLEAHRETEYAGKWVLATVTAVFGYDNPTVEGQIVEIRPEFEALIRSNSYNCLEGNGGCVETFVLETEYSDFLRFIGLVRGAAESVSVESTVVTVDTMQPESGEH
jgi:CopG family nickel-responsive transcriptional regulator